LFVCFIYLVFTSIPDRYSLTISEPHTYVSNKIHCTAMHSHTDAKEIFHAA